MNKKIKNTLLAMPLIIGCSATDNSIYDGRIRDFFFNGKPCGKIQFRKDGGIVISGCIEAVRALSKAESAPAVTP